MFAEGRILGDKGFRIAEASGHSGSLMLAYRGLGLLSLRQGDLSGALTRLEWAMRICHDADLPGYVPLVAAALGAAYILGGRAADAVPMLTQALEQATAMDTIGFQVLCSLTLGEARMLTGRLEEAHAFAEWVLTHTRARQERGRLPSALRLLGEIAARREPPAYMLAEAYYRQALDLTDEFGMRPLQAHCHRGLGTLYAAIGQREQAHTELSTAITLYRDMDMTFWLPQAEAGLAQMERQ
jgi:tetratricopeptide (TPR) repeat protein